MRQSFRLLPVLIFVFACLSITPATAQENYRRISGSVRAADTGEPIPFASVGLAGKSIGTVTNTAGVFVFTIPGAYLPDSLQISCVGYTTFRRAVSGTPAEEINVSLEPATLALDEVEVRTQRLDALDIIREAIAAIPRNYDTTAVQLGAFYREATRLDDYEIAFTEAVLDVYTPALADAGSQRQMRLVKGRKKPLDHSPDPAFYNWLNLSGGAKYALQSSDLLALYRQPHKRSFLNAQNFRHYRFSLHTILSDGDRHTYVIAVEPEKKSSRALARAKLFIDVQSLAFIRSEVEATQPGLDAENKRNALGKKIGSVLMGASLKLTGFTEIVNYEKRADHWYVHDVRRELTGRVTSKKRRITAGLWKTHLSFTVTDVRKSGIGPFPEGDMFGSDIPMSFLIGNEDDGAFWENYNIIQPEPSGAVFPRTDSLPPVPEPETKVRTPVSNRQNGFTRADTLRGTLTPLRTCYDVSFYHLDVAVDIAGKSIRGQNTMRFRVTEPFRQLQVDLYANMAIHRIQYRGQPLTFTREYDAVFIQFPEILPAGTEQEITITYSGTPQVPDFSVPMKGGFLWDTDREGNPWVQVVCQGSGASLWWPNKDHLSDEPDSMKISVTVPEGLMNISNGRLIRVTQLPDKQTRYDWYVSYPINNYNVTLNIGKYAHVPDQYIRGRDTLTLDYYVLSYNLETARRVVFPDVKPMLACLEKHFGPYPFPCDGFTLMESLYPMEHQSAVSFGKMPAGEAIDSLGLLRLVWHEVAHEWWGNSVSCRDMADLWIHEAFATWSEGLYWKSKLGAAGETAHWESLRDSPRNREPIVGVYGVNHIFYDIEDMYSKGALMLHTFRQVINNDSLWQNMLYGIPQRFAHQTIGTDDMIAYINQQTGTDYTYFFRQYLHFPDIPRLRLQLRPQGQSLTVRYRWEAGVPDFRMPIRVSTASGQPDFIYPTTSWQTITLPRMKPDDFAVDETQFYGEVVVEE